MAYHPFRNIGLKIMAVLLATALWFTVAGESEVERSMRVPLEFRNKPMNLEIVGDAPTTVDIRVSGSSALLGRLEAGEVIAVLDVASTRAGSRIFPMRPDDVRVPYGVEVLQVIPATIPLELEQSMKRSVPIVPAVDGDPAPGFVTGRVTVEPATVDVVGPESHVKNLASATTEPIPVGGAREDVSDEVTVGVSDGAVRLLGTERARVRVQILPAPVERAMPNVPVRWRNLGDRYTAVLKPSVVVVTVRVRRDAVQTFSAETINAFVDLAGLGPGQYNLQVQFDPTQNFGVAAAEPATVQVTIK
jgi:YbbR domain-containing protein